MIRRLAWAGFTASLAEYEAARRDYVQCGSEIRLARERVRLLRALLAVDGGRSNSPMKYWMRMACLLYASRGGDLWQTVDYLGT